MKLLSDYINSHVEALLGAAPFHGWAVDKSIETGLDQPIVQYVFPERSIEIRCDSNNRITSIFIEKDRLDGIDPSQLEVSFNWTRKQVIQELGSPASSGKSTRHPVLGNYGPWDKFKLQDHFIHVEYGNNDDTISRITLMR